jgi:Protein of unknown function (DUF4236)
MGFYFRRSMNLGPFRVNLSRGGLGWSVGGRGFRTGRSGRGRRYSTISIPGTGMGYRTSSRTGCLLLILIAPIAALLALSAATMLWGTLA